MMATMTPREQIEVGDLVRWEHPDRTKWAEGRLIRLHTPIAQPCADVDVQSSNFLSAGETATLGLGCEAVFCRILSIRTPVGDIPVRVDPTLKPDEFRIETDPTEEHARRVLAESVSRDTSAVFPIDPLEPNIANEVRAEAQRRANEDGRGGEPFAAVDYIGAILDEHYPRDENGRHYIPAPPKVDWSKLTKTRTRPYEPLWQPNPGYPRPAEKLHEHFVDYMTKNQPTRPDGFVQSKIDEIKAMLTAPVKGKR